jgi:hypothetical protein
MADAACCHLGAMPERAPRVEAGGRCEKLSPKGCHLCIAAPSATCRQTRGGMPASTPKLVAPTVRQQQARGPCFAAQGRRPRSSSTSHPPDNLHITNTPWTPWARRVRSVGFPTVRRHAMCGGVWGSHPCWPPLKCKAFLRNACQLSASVALPAAPQVRRQHAHSLASGASRCGCGCRHRRCGQHDAAALLKGVAVCALNRRQTA